MHQRRSAGTTNGSNHGSSNNKSNGTMYGRGGFRGGGGGGMSPGAMEAGGGLSSSEANSNIMEMQNNERIAELSDQVSALKRLTIDIGNEVRDQNSLLDQMDSGFMATRDLLAGSLKKIGTMLESGGAKHMCYMVAFVVVVMIILYRLMKSK